MSLLKKLFKPRKAAVEPKPKARLTQLASQGPRLHGEVCTKVAGYFGCELNGNIRAYEELWIEPTGDIQGNIRGTDLSVEGRVQGDIHTSGETALKNKSEVRGNIYANSLTLESGARFYGVLIIGDEEKNLTLNLKAKH